MRLALVHSPLTGPSVWTSVARELARRGFDTVVPSPPARIASWRDFTSGIAAGIGQGDLVLVGHSGAGPLLPLVALELGRTPSSYVFVDAGLPEPGSALSTMPPDLASRLLELAHGGELPPWSAWWPEKAFRDLVPDESLRSVIAAECPSLPLSFFQEERPGASWRPDAPVGFVRLSAAYDAAAGEAEARGWPVVRLDGSHLLMVVDPVAVTDAILAVAS